MNCGYAAARKSNRLRMGVGQKSLEIVDGSFPNMRSAMEFSRRPGLEAVQLKPYEDQTVTVSGPATSSINRD